jgi:hypothetical protein
MAQDNRISRRELLRSVGIAGATVWGVSDPHEGSRIGIPEDESAQAL